MTAENFSYIYRFNLCAKICAKIESLSKDLRKDLRKEQRLDRLRKDSKVCARIEKFQSLRKESNLCADGPIFARPVQSLRKGFFPLSNSHTPPLEQPSTPERFETHVRFCASRFHFGFYDRAQRSQPIELITGTGPQPFDRSLRLLLAPFKFPNPPLLPRPI